MKITEWPVGVNRIVTSEASVEIGRDGIKTDKAENGSEMSRPTGLGAPDVWSVSMFFSNARDSFYRRHGKTEWQAFRDWVKFSTRNCVFPFHFSKIDDPSDTAGTCVYRITSGVPRGTPFGDQMKVTMTWAEVFTGTIEIPNLVPDGDYIDVSAGLIDFRFTEAPEDAPSKEDFAVRVSYNGGSRADVAINGFEWDGNKSCLLYVDEPHQAGLYTYYVTWSGKVFTGSTVAEESNE